MHATPLTAMSIALSLRYQCGLPSPNAVNRASRRLRCGFARTLWSNVATRFKCGLWRQRYGQRRLLYGSLRFMTAAVRLQQGFSTDAFQSTTTTNDNNNNNTNNNDDNNNNNDDVINNNNANDNNNSINKINIDDYNDDDHYHYFFFY